MCMLHVITFNNITITYAYNTTTGAETLRGPKSELLKFLKFEQLQICYYQLNHTKVLLQPCKANKFI